MSKKEATTTVLPLNTPIIIRAFHKENGKQFDKESTYGEWLNLKKDKNYRYIALQVI